MNVSITQVPVWLSLLFILCFSIVPVYLIASTVNTTYKRSNLTNGNVITKRIVLFYSFYFLLTGLLSAFGFFEENSLPPRILLFTVIPLFLFYMVYVRRTGWFKLVVKTIKLEQLIYIHVFRFVGVFFFLVYYFDAIPKEFAFIGGTGDIISALLAIPVVIALKKSAPYAKLYAWIWNIIGLLDIVSVLVTAVILTNIALETGGNGVQQFATFPFSWIPAFAPATIIFLHIITFQKLIEQKSN